MWHFYLQGYRGEDGRIGQKGRPGETVCLLSLNMLLKKKRKKVFSCFRFFRLNKTLPYFTIQFWCLACCRFTCIRGWQYKYLILRRQLSLSRGLTSIKLCADRSFLTHSDQVFLTYLDFLWYEDEYGLVMN